MSGFDDRYDAEAMRILDQWDGQTYGSLRRALAAALRERDEKAQALARSVQLPSSPGGGRG